MEKMEKNFCIQIGCRNRINSFLIKTRTTVFDYNIHEGLQRYRNVVIVITMNIGNKKY